MIKYLLPEYTTPFSKVYTGIQQTSAGFTDMPTVEYEDYLEDIRKYEDEEKHAKFLTEIREWEQRQQKHRKEIEKTKKYAQKVVQPLPKETRISHKVKRLIYNFEDVHIIASAALALGMKKNDKTEILSEEHLQSIMYKSKEIIDDYENFKNK